MKETEYFVFILILLLCIYCTIFIEILVSLGNIVIVFLIFMDNFVGTLQITYLLVTLN